MKKIHKKAIENIRRIMMRWGYTYSDAFIYGILLVNEEPMTINDLIEKSKLSRSAVSSSLARLERDYFVQVTKKGRMKYHIALPLFAEKFLEQPKKLLEKEVLPLRNLIDELSNSGNEEYKKKIKHILDNIDVLVKILKDLIEKESKEFHKKF